MTIPGMGTREEALPHAPQHHDQPGGNNFMGLPCTLSFHVGYSLSSKQYHSVKTILRGKVV